MRQAGNLARSAFFDSGARKNQRASAQNALFVYTPNISSGCRGLIVEVSQMCGEVSQICRETQKRPCQWHERFENMIVVFWKIPSRSYT